MGKIALFVLLLCTCFAVGQGEPKVLPKAEVQQLVPASYFFAGQTATTQTRNAGGVRFPDGKAVLVALVDNSGYSSGVAQQYQGLLITQVPLRVGDKTVPPGSYGFGMPSPDHFGVLDVNANEIARGTPTAIGADERPLPLRVDITPEGLTIKMGKRALLLQFAK